MAYDNPFRDDFVDENKWEAFDEFGAFDDYDCVLADAATNNKHQADAGMENRTENHSLSVSDLNQFRNISLTIRRSDIAPSVISTQSIQSNQSYQSRLSSRFSDISSCPPTPYLPQQSQSSSGVGHSQHTSSLPSTDTGPSSCIHDQMNEDFWHDLFDQPLKDRTNKPKIKSAVVAVSTTESINESPQSPTGSTVSTVFEEFDRFEEDPMVDPKKIPPLTMNQTNKPTLPSPKMKRKRKKRKRDKKRKKKKERRLSQSQLEGIEPKTSAPSASPTNSPRSSVISVSSLRSLSEINEDENGIDGLSDEEGDHKDTSIAGKRRKAHNSKSSGKKRRRSSIASTRPKGRRRSSYKLSINPSKFDETRFNVKAALSLSPVNLFEIGKIIDTLRGKQNGWDLQSYLMTYKARGRSSPIFEISHPKKGTHLVLGVYPRLKEVAPFLKHHPLILLMDEYNITKCYTPVRYTKRSGFNYGLQTVISSTISKVTVENLSVMDEEYQIINREFHKQCEKLFDKILYGKGDWKKIPGVDSVFITHWNTFMRKYRLGVEQAYLNGDLKAYILLVSLFWTVVLRFKKQNRCKDLSKVLSGKMARKVVGGLEERLDDQHSSITLVSFNLLFRPNGVFEKLKENGWDIQMMDEDKIAEYRKRNAMADKSLLQQSVWKVAKHAGKVMSWSRNKETCLVM